MMKKNNQSAPFGALMLGMLFVALALRAPMSSVGPLVPQIKADLGISSAVSGMLTTIPVLFFATMASVCSVLIRKLGLYRLTLGCLASILGGILIRSYGGTVGLFLGTAFIGAGVGLLNVAIPVFIRSAFTDKIGLAMGTYTLTMNILSSLAAGISVWLSQLLLGWQNSLALWGFFSLAAIPGWAFFARSYRGGDPQPPAADDTEKPRAPVIKSVSNWFIAIFMGGQSVLYYIYLTWLPSIVLDKTGDAGLSSFSFLYMQAVGLITNFLSPVIVQRMSRKGILAAISAGLYTLGTLTIMLVGSNVFVLFFGITLCGLGVGSCLSLALTFITLKGKTHEGTARLSAFAQAIGYGLAAPGPFIIGGLYDASGSWVLPLTALFILCLPLIFISWRAGNLASEAAAG